MFILFRYILKEHIAPFFLSLFVLTFLMLMDRVLDLLDLIISKGLKPLVVLEVFALSLPFMIAVTVPMAVLVAVLMAFGRLAGDNEITAMKSSGISFTSIIISPLIASIFLTIGMIYFNNNILPETNHRVKNLMMDIHRKRPTIEIKEGIFNEFEGYNLLINKIDYKTSNIYDVIAQELKNGKLVRTITSKRGRLNFSPDGNTLTIELLDGEMHAVDENDPSRYHRLTFKTQKINIQNIGSELQRENNESRGDRELSAYAMQLRIRDIKKARESDATRLHYMIVQRINQMLSIVGVDSLQSSTFNFQHSISIFNSQLQSTRSLEGHNVFYERVKSEKRILEARNHEILRYQVEIHKKYSIPFACIVFVLLGAPLGVLVRRGGKMVGFAISFSISFFFFTLYYIFLIGGEDLADRGIIPPFWAMWAPNIFLGIIGLYLFILTVYEVPMIRWDLIQWKKLNPFKK